MLEPGVTNTQVVIPAKVIKLEMIRIFVQILFRIGSSLGSDEMGTSFSPLTGPSVCIHEYDLRIHLITVREGLRESGIEVNPIIRIGI